MYYVMDAHSFYNFIYFILLIIVSIRLSVLQTKSLQKPGVRSTQIPGKQTTLTGFLLGILGMQLVDFH